MRSNTLRSASTLRLHRGGARRRLALATHIENSDTYRMTVYADAKDGWYRNTGAMLRAGLQDGVSLGRHDVILRAGRLVDFGGKPPLLPFYGTLTFNTRW